MYFLSCTLYKFVSFIHWPVLFKVIDIKLEESLLSTRTVMCFSVCLIVYIGDKLSWWCCCVPTMFTDVSPVCLAGGWTSADVKLVPSRPLFAEDKLQPNRPSKCHLMTIPHYLCYSLCLRTTSDTQTLFLTLSSASNYTSALPQIGVKFFFIYFSLFLRFNSLLQITIQFQTFI